MLPEFTLWGVVADAVVNLCDNGNHARLLVSWSRHHRGIPIANPHHFMGRNLHYGHRVHTRRSCYADGKHL